MNRPSGVPVAFTEAILGDGSDSKVLNGAPS
jgi:hypothetical protein